MLLLFGAGLVYSFFYPYPYSYEQVESVPTLVIDQDNSYSSRTLTRLLKAAPNLNVIQTDNDTNLIAKRLWQGDIMAMVIIPRNFNNDLMAGTVNMMFANMPSMLPQVRAGKLRGLGVTSAQRSKAAPDIPAIAETVPGYVATSWYGVGAPAGTPEPILARLEAAIAEALKSPDIQKRLHDMEFEIVASSPKQFSDWIGTEIVRWGKVIKDTGAKAE